MAMLDPEQLDDAVRQRLGWSRK